MDLASGNQVSCPLTPNTHFWYVLTPKVCTGYPVGMLVFAAPVQFKTYYILNILKSKLNAILAHLAPLPSPILFII